jgi:hypothetical protein
MCAVYVGSRAKADKKKILHTRYTLHSHAEGTNFRTHKQADTPESKSVITDDYGQQKW